MSESPQPRFDHERSWSEAEASRQNDPLMQALHAVPVPAVLPSKLLDRLAQDASPHIEVEDRLLDEGQGPTRSRRWMLSRRQWLAGTLAAGVGAVASYQWLRRPLSQETVLTSVRGRLADWNPTWSTPPAPADVLDNIPLPRSLTFRRRNASVYDWEILTTEYSRKTVVYKLLGKPSIWLFAANTWRDLSRLPAGPPTDPPRPSGPWICVTWRESDCYLYVLALRQKLGWERHYDKLLSGGGASSLA